MVPSKYASPAGATEEILKYITCPLPPLGEFQTVPMVSYSSTEAMHI